MTKPPSPLVTDAPAPLTETLSATSVNAIRVSPPAVRSSAKLPVRLCEPGRVSTPPVTRTAAEPPPNVRTRVPPRVIESGSENVTGLSVMLPEVPAAVTARWPVPLATVSALAIVRKFVVVSVLLMSRVSDEAPEASRAETNETFASSSRPPAFTVTAVPVDGDRGAGDGDAEGADDVEARDVQGDRAADRAGRRGGADREVRGAVGDGDQAAGQGQRGVADGDRRGGAGLRRWSRRRRASGRRRRA